VNAQGKHTPGPWSSLDSGQIVGPQWQPVAKLHPIPRWSGITPHPQLVANARLIAAAPQLLEVCRLAYERMRDLPSLDYTDASMVKIVLEKLDAAITAATGDAP
jgi:hypothetical protein